MTNIIQPSRRGFITGLTSIIVAPAIVRVENIMPVKMIKRLSIADIDNEFFHYMYDSHTSDIIKYGSMFTKRIWVDDNFLKQEFPLTEIYENKI